MMPDKCKCIAPKLVGKEIKFMTQKGGQRVNYRDYRVDCQICKKFYSYMARDYFEMAHIPTYEELLG